MTDIIANAKRLLEGTTPAPWKVYAWERHPDSDVYVMNEDAVILTDEGWIHPADGHLIAAAPELAAALAEETWEYGVTYTGLKHGGDHIKWVEATDDPEWDKETLASEVRQWRKRGQSPRIVRRRVSQPEVIEGI